MRLGLLGPFEVFLDDVPQRLPGRGERALLALLAFSVGRVVATTTLVDQLWPSGALPEDPQNASQIRASKLRRALTTAAGADVIVRHGTGYWLNMRSAATRRRCRCCGRRSRSRPGRVCTTPCNGPPPTSASPCWGWVASRRPRGCFSRAGSAPDQVGDDAGKILAIYGNALVAQRGGQRVAARALFERAYTGLERLGVRLATGLALAGIAGRDEQAGDLAAARNAYEKLLTLGQSWAEAGLIVGGLEGLARSDLAHADPVGAAELLARAAWLRDAYDRPATAPERAAADRVAAQARTALGAQRYAEAANRGAAAAAGAAV